MSVSMFMSMSMLLFMFMCEYCSAYFYRQLSFSILSTYITMRLPMLIYQKIKRKMFCKYTSVVSEQLSALILKKKSMEDTIYK
jgi:hypothetical protein